MLITDAQKEIIRTTVNLIKTHSPAIVKCFYERVRVHNPELQQYVNVGYFQSGLQAIALSRSVLAFVKHMDNPEMLLAAIRHIGHKHASVGFKSEHYPIVGCHLMESVKEVLGEKVTPEAIEAWSLVYDYLSNVMMEIEADIHQKSIGCKGTWVGWRSFKVVRKTTDTDSVKTLTLAPVDGKLIPKVLPGQYVSVRMNIPELHLVQPRQYTVTRATSKQLDITVKSIGLVSRALHRAEEGELIDLSAPKGEFSLPAGDGPLVLISAGIGITPMIAMLRQIPETRFVNLVHTCKSEQDFVQRRIVQAILGKAYNRVCDIYYSEEARMRPSKLMKTLYKGAHYRVCGPESFMESVVYTLGILGVEPDYIQCERFGAEELFV